MAWTSSNMIVTADTTVVEQYKSWEFQQEYDTLGTPPLWAKVDSAWRLAQEEHVNGNAGDADENDRTCACHCYPISAQEWTGDPWWGPVATFTHARSVSFNDPDSGTRPSLWETDVGGVAVSGDSDVWTVAPGTGAPSVFRTVSSRYWLRMDRLGDHLDDAEAEHYQFWPIISRRSTPADTATTFGDDPDWWSSATGGVDAEDVRCWENYSYVLLTLTAPVAGTVTMTVDYSTVSVSDPCYTCFEHRFGAEGEWDYTRTQRTLTFSKAVVAGANTILIDLCCNAEKVIPEKDYRLWHVDKVTFDLPANATEANQVWTLGDLVLTVDPGNGTRMEPAAHCEVRYRRDWNWIGYHWLGFGLVVDGKHCCELDMGYSYSRYERGIPYILHSAHCPDSELADRLDSAIALSTAIAWLAWQEGWSSSYYPSPAPEVTADNQDTDENQFASALYCWDMVHCCREEFAGMFDGSWHGSYDAAGAVTVGSILPPAGVPVELHFSVYPQGMVDGIAMNGSQTRRSYSKGTVHLYGKHTDDTIYTWEDSSPVDDWGRFKVGPCKELDKVYGIKGKLLTGEITAAMLATAGLQVANREYQTHWCPVAGGGLSLATTRDSVGQVTWACWIEGDTLKIAERDTEDTVTHRSITAPTATWSDYDSPSIEMAAGRVTVYARLTDTEKAYTWHSDDYGETWTGPTLVL